MERSMTSPNAQLYSVAPRAASFRCFGRGLIGGFIGGRAVWPAVREWLFGGLGGGMSILGLLLQIAFCFLLFKLVHGPFMRGRRPAFQQGHWPRIPAGSRIWAGRRCRLCGLWRRAGGARPRETKLRHHIRLISASSSSGWRRSKRAFGAEDFEHLRALATPEMASFFAETSPPMPKKGLVNKAFRPLTLPYKVIRRGWRERKTNYATVAMKILPWTTPTRADRVSGKSFVSGASGRWPQQVTEVWTFAGVVLAAAQAIWKLSAIQQALSRTSRRQAGLSGENRV